MHLHRNGLEDIETVGCRGYDRSGDLRVPVQLLDLGLTLVDEHYLRGHFAVLRLVDSAHFVVVQFHTEIPYRDLIVGAGGSEDGILCGVPFDGSNRSFVP